MNALLDVFPKSPVNKIEVASWLPLIRASDLAYSSICFWYYISVSRYSLFEVFSFSLKGHLCN